MAQALASEEKGIAVALVGYRLSTQDTPSVKHPDHITDVYAALTFLVKNDSAYAYDSTQLVLVGHSVGAWMALASVMEPDLSFNRCEGALSMPVLDPRIQQAIGILVLVVSLSAHTGRHI